MIKILKFLKPFQLFTAGGLTTVILFRGIKFLASHSKTVEKSLEKGFDVVENNVEELKSKVLPVH